MGRRGARHLRKRSAQDRERHPGARRLRQGERASGAEEPEARAASVVGAPAQAPAEMWEPRVGGGVAMTTERRGFGLKASPSLRPGTNAVPSNTHTRAHTHAGGWLKGRDILRAVPCPLPNLSPGPVFLPD